jgi:hypothetical protein
MAQLERAGSSSIFSSAALHTSQSIVERTIVLLSLGVSSILLLA